VSDWIRKERASLDRQNNKTGNGISESGGCFQAYIESTSGESQNAKLTYSGGARSISLPMPFESSDSWIRSIPSSGSAALITYRRDTGEPTFLRYLNDVPDKKIAAYQGGGNVYRPLLPGEHEIHSSGYAQAYFGQRPVLDLRAGAIRSWLSQDQAECGQKSPIHTRQLHDHRSNDIGNEERFGIVRRPAKLNPLNAVLLGSQKSSNFQKYPYPNFSLPGGIPNVFSTIAEGVAKASELLAAATGTFKMRPFAKEYLRVIKNPLSPLPPSKLIDIREGQVFDDDGVQMKGEGGAYLRAKHEYFTMSGSTKLEIDELGNVTWSLDPLLAMNGWVTTIPFGAWKLEANKGIEMKTLTSITTSSTLATSISATTNVNISSTLNTTIDTGMNFTHSANGKYTVSSKLPMAVKSDMNVSMESGMIYNIKGGTQLNLNAPKVQIGSSPAEPCVMGDQLSTWLTDFCKVFADNKMNIGVGNMGAPVPLNPAIDSAIQMLSQKIKLLTSKTITVTA